MRLRTSEIINMRHFLLVLIVIAPFLVASSSITKAIHKITSVLLKSVSQQEEIFKMSDADKNGRNDYGTLEALIQSKLIDRIEETKIFADGNKIYESGSYYFLVNLPAEPDLKEKHWCAFAWPIKYADRVFLSFFINEQGKIFGIDEPQYSGAEHFPKPEDVYIGQPFVGGINTGKWLPEEKLNWGHGRNASPYLLIFFVALLMAASGSAEIIVWRRRKQAKGNQGGEAIKKYYAGYNVAGVICFFLAWLPIFIMGSGDPYALLFFIFAMIALGVFFSDISIEGTLFSRMVHILFNAFLGICCVAILFLIGYGIAQIT